MNFPFLKEALTNLFKQPSTRNFPAENVEAKPNYRGRISYDPEKCVNCGMCVKVCSPGAITRDYEDVEGGQKITYNFDLTSCTFCALCQDFCNEKAVQLTTDYHMVAESREDLIVRGTKFRENTHKELRIGDDCVFCGLCARNCPNEAITVDRNEKLWKVDTEKCIQCGICVSKCPKKTLKLEEPAPLGVTKTDECVYCTLCAKKCPVNAISVIRTNKIWEIDRDTCINCGTCISSCPKKALKMAPIEE